jgi:DNA-binding LacI/PurR family transcriptional regulator
VEPHYKQVKAKLTEALKGGELLPGGALPGERVLADRYGVSYMTARRAIEELVGEGLFERRGKRTLVKPDALRFAGALRVNILCSYLNTFSSPLLKEIDAIAHEQNWIAQVMIVHGANDHLARRAIASGEPCFFLIPDERLLQDGIREALQSPHGPIVIVGNRFNEKGVAWIKADDRQGMKLALRHLDELGHTSILYVRDDVEHAAALESLEEWQAYVRERGGLNPQEPLIVRTTSLEPRPHLARQAIKRYWTSKEPPTAIICNNDELTLGILHGLRELNVDVPRDVSVVCMGDTLLVEHSVPSITVVDVCFDRHIRVAVDIMLDALSGSPLVGQGELITPRLIARESTARWRGRR